MYAYYETNTTPNPHLLPHLDGHATTPHYTSAWEAMNPSMDLLNMLVSKHWKTSQATHQPLCIVIHQSSFLNFVIQAMRSLLKHLRSIAREWLPEKVIRELGHHWLTLMLGPKSKAFLGLHDRSSYGLVWTCNLKVLWPWSQWTKNTVVFRPTVWLMWRMVALNRWGG